MENFIIYKGIKIHYITFGSGEATLFLHGWEGSVDSFKFVANELEGQKILIDLPPFGKSQMPQNSWNLYDYVGLVKYIIENLQITKYNIVAHSFGGRIALILACSNNVNKMVLTGCAGIKDKSLKVKCKKLNYKIKKALCKLKLYNKQKLINQGSNDYKKLNDTMKQTFNNIINFDLSNILNLIEAETLLIWGKKDTSTPIKDAMLMNKKIKNSGLYIYENGSHFAYIEYGKSFINAVKLFLNL
ncbi:MAG: alpha/beta fold hydrolase [Christensenellales bacterium]